MTKTLEDALGISAHRSRQPGMVGFAKYVMMQIFPRMKHSHPPFFELIYDIGHKALAYLVVHDGASADKSFENSLLIRLVNELKIQELDEATEYWDVFEAQSLLALTDRIPPPHDKVRMSDVVNPSKALSGYFAMNTKTESGYFVYISHPNLQQIAAGLRSAYAQHAMDRISVNVVVPEGFSSTKEVNVQAKVISPSNAVRLREAFEEVLVKYDAVQRLGELGAICMGLSLPGDWDFNCPAAYNIPTMDGYISANVGMNAGPPAHAGKLFRREKK